MSPTAAVKHIPSTADRVSSVLQRKPRIENGKFLARTLLGDPVEYAELTVRTEHQSLWCWHWKLLPSRTWESALCNSDCNDVP